MAVLAVLLERALSVAKKLTNSDITDHFFALGRSHLRQAPTIAAYRNEGLAHRAQAS